MPIEGLVVLCGSTKFKEDFERVAKAETLKGKLVIAPHVYRQSGDAITDAQREMLLKLHLRAVDIADELLVVDPGGYIGEATRLVINAAEELRVPVRRMSQEP
jgi:hypothetical protein